MPRAILFLPFRQKYPSKWGYKLGSRPMQSRWCIKIRSSNDYVLRKINLMHMRIIVAHNTHSYCIVIVKVIQWLFSNSKHFIYSSNANQWKSMSILTYHNHVTTAISLLDYVSTHVHLSITWLSSSQRYWVMSVTTCTYQSRDYRDLGAIGWCQ